MWHYSQPKLQHNQLSIEWHAFLHLQRNSPAKQETSKRTHKVLSQHCGCHQTLKMKQNLPRARLQPRVNVSCTSMVLCFSQPTLETPEDPRKGSEEKRITLYYVYHNQCANDRTLHVMVQKWHKNSSWCFHGLTVWSDHQSTQKYIESLGPSFPRQVPTLLSLPPCNLVPNCPEGTSKLMLFEPT